MIDKKGLFIAVLMSAVLVGPAAMAGKKKPTPKQQFTADVANAQTTGAPAPSQPASPPPPARPADEMISFKWINANILNGGQYACAKCHGQGDSNIDPTSYETVLQSAVFDDTNAVPEDPNNSELYNAIAPPSSMPYDNDQNPVQLKAEYYGAVYWWIKAGAPNN